MSELLTPLSSATAHVTPNAEMHRYPGSSVAVWRSSLAPGSAGPVHEIDREQVVVVVDGELSVVVDGTSVVAGPGESVVLPSGAVRQLRNDGAAATVTITCAVPGSVARVGEGDPIVVPWSA